jgi:hypothetical protein
MMDIRNQLTLVLEKKYIDKLVADILTKPNDFQQIYDLMFDAEEKVAWRAGWGCTKICSKVPDLFSDFHYVEILNLASSTKFHGVQRACLSILFELNRPQLLTSDFINNCFEWMISPKYPIAVQAYSMKILFQFCNLEPDFKFEFKAYLENIEINNYSVGFATTRKNILKMLDNR